MPVSKVAPTANPLALVRSLPVKMIPIDQIQGDLNRQVDNIFLARYKAFLIGRAPIHQTRLPLKQIRRGYWSKKQQEWTYESEIHGDAALESFIQTIRSGNRPVLHLYESPNPLDSYRYVCSDDTVAHAAYERLGIAKVPVALMAKPRDLDESCLSVRSFSRGRGEAIPLLDGVVPVESALVPSVLGAEKPRPMECFKELLSALSTLKQRVRTFHLADLSVLHYHHTLYSVLLRAEDCIESMRLLIAADKPLTAVGLLRSLHELALVFYVDWLSPGTTYQYLQMSSVMTEKEWDAMCTSWQKEDIAAGASIIEAKNIRDAHMRGFRLACIVGERARLFPLGEKFQRDIYSFLSDVIHHDFSMTARYAFTLDHGDEAVYHEDVLSTIIHLSDVLVGSIVSRIQDDIGHVPTPIK